MSFNGRQFPGIKNCLDSRDKLETRNCFKMQNAGLKVEKKIPKYNFEF